MTFLRIVWRVTIILLLLVYSAAHSCTLSVKVFTQQEMAHHTLIDEHIMHTGTDAYVCKVTDGVHLFILKQIADPSLDEQFLLINDAVASTIGYRAGIKVNEVFFIPYDVASHLKMYPDRAATLHTYIVGHDLESQFPTFLPEHFDIHQHTINITSIWQRQYPLAENQQGLTAQVIESMSLHEQLVGLCALDTFVGNSDRSFPNIFYHSISGVFYGIDQAAAFSKCLPAFAGERINELIKVGYFESCSLDILAQLRLYQEILCQLYKNNEPAAVFQSMVDLVPHLAPDAPSCDEIKERLVYHRLVLEKNYGDVMHLLQKLDGINQAGAH